MAKVRFKINYEKCIQGMHYLAYKRPGITQYYVGKVFFFADREHLLDWGRPISGDRYMAMQYGPVPSVIYDLVKSDAGIPDELIDAVKTRIVFEHAGNKIKLSSKLNNPTFPDLTASDIEYLDESLRLYGTMPFGRLCEISHEDLAYEEAWSQHGNANEMNPALWLKSLGEEEKVTMELVERGVLDLLVA